MPYSSYRRRRPAYRPKRRYAPKPPISTTKRIVRAEIRKEDRKDYPLQWVDVKWTGNYIKTTPTLLSLSEAVKNEIEDRQSWTPWPLRRDSAAGQDYRQADIFITGYNYQLRFQQNEEAATDVTTDTVRALMYSFNDTYQEDSGAILDGGDVDQPPRTEDLRSMYMDRLFTLRAGYTEGETDDSQFVPGYKILKGWKKLNNKFTIVHNESLSATIVTEGGDIRFEFQSDDNATVGEVELFGYVRIYYRVMA